ncbi:MAG: 50S ribosomal protein L25 [Elusimicrobia bacterium]|nr:50S ribosomal protein L25 [Elusimicrobiota bacterium]
MEELKLVVEKRDGKNTKGELSTLRAAAKIPAVIYGGDKPPVQVALSEKELLAARKKGGVNAILHLQLGKAQETVIVKELQRHPVTERLVHADFQRILLTQEIEAKVPLQIMGEAPGVKNSGGILQHELRVLSVKALPTHIPQFIEVDVTGLELNQAVHVKDLKVGSDLKILDDAEHIVVHVTQVKEEVAAVAAPAAGEEAAATAAEPELSATKGKKDEEGKPLPKAAASAAPEKGKEPAKKEGAK